jgi:diacylglycerol kinase (CTP)
MSVGALSSPNSSFPSTAHDTPSRRRQTPRRSTSPRVNFTPSPHPSDKGVKNITLKVIRRLEGLGHLDEEDTAMHDDIEEEGEVVEVLHPAQNGHSQNGTAAQAPIAKIVVSNGVANGHATPVDSPKKIDWEIPRKLFHSSIGACPLSCAFSRSLTCSDRICDDISLCLRGKSPDCRHCPLDCTLCDCPS